MLSLSDFAEENFIYRWKGIPCFTLENNDLSIRMENVKWFPWEVRQFLMNFNPGEKTFFTEDGTVSVPRWIANSVSLFIKNKEKLPLSTDKVQEFLTLVEKYWEGKDLSSAEQDFMEEFDESFLSLGRDYLHMNNFLFHTGPPVDRKEAKRVHLEVGRLMAECLFPSYVNDSPLDK